MDYLTALYAQLDRFRFGDFQKVIVGLSGGSDSLALTLAAHSYLADKHPDCELIAVTVDHGLRAESASEAQRVGQICLTHGITHEVVRWTGEKPSASIQQKAREARYRLLSERAEQHGTSLALIAHNKGDDLETRLMRAQRQNANDAVHGISAATLYECKTWFARPFLDLDKVQLQDFLRAQGVGWIEDPSNKDRRFERVRMRQDMDKADLDALLLTDDQPVGAAICAYLASSDNLTISDNGAQIVLHHIDPENASHHEVLRVLLSLVGATPYLPALSGVKEAIHSLYEIPDNGRKFTLNGCLIIKRREGLAIVREQRNEVKSRFGFDLILPSRDYEIASVLRDRRGLPPLPPLPMR